LRKSETIAPFHCGSLLRIEAFVNDDSAAIEPNRAEDVGAEPASVARHIKQAGQIVELDTKFQVLLDDVLNRNRRAYFNAPGMGILSEQTHAGNILRNQFDRSEVAGIIRFHRDVEALILSTATVIGEVQCFLD
jgi:hypothetical protein